ncbi:MAG: efflux RND transporter permease subunit [Stenotrophomonas maltophilia]|jgi:multidrug efflux pump|nr:efflux RND transporter permease subunit [Stenotrophomonas maltophilia]
MVRFFIDRPIFAWVIAIAVSLLGLLAILILPVDRYPQIAPPTITIRATYTGASSQTVENAVTQVIEQSQQSLDHLMYMTSTSASDGSAQVNLVFATGTNPDTAQVQVQNQLQAAMATLPQAVQQNGLTITKSSGSIFEVLSFTSEDGSMDNFDVANFMEARIDDQISRVSGVGNIQPIGQEYAMRIWLDPEKMRQYALMPSDIETALQAQNTDVSAGELGGQPALKGQQLDATVTARSRLHTPEQFAQVVLKADANGSVVHLGDVATIGLGPESYDSISTFNGKPSASLGIELNAGANAIAVSKAVEARLQQLQKYWPHGYTYHVAFTTTPFVTISLKEVVITLIEAIALVVLVMYLFLQNWRATLIPTIAVPVVLLGTFGVLAAFGYSINTLTMFALVLAIGLLVDDAIVVVENVERLMHEEHLSPKDATIKSMGQVSGALVGIGLVISAVFVPMAFMSGSTGVIYRQFAITIASAMCLSVLVALIFTPALCASILKAPTPGKKPARFFDWFNRVFNRGASGYAIGVGGAIKRSKFFLLLYVLLLAAMVALFSRIPTAFLPEEDQGMMMVQVQLPPNASAARTEQVLQAVSNYLREKEQETVASVMSVNGFNFAGRGQNSGLLFVSLKPFDDRKQAQQHLSALHGRTWGFVSQINDAMVIPIMPPAIMELGNATGFDFFLQDNAGVGHEVLMQARNQMLGMAAQNPKLAMVRPNGLSDEPQYQIEIDEEKARALKLNLAEVNSTMSIAWGSAYVNDFIDRGRVKKVYLQGQANSRVGPDDFSKWYVRNEDGQMVSFNSFASGKWVYGAAKLERYNGVPAAEIVGTPAPGISTGEAMALVESLAKQLPPGVDLVWTGLSYEEVKAGSQSAWILSLSLLMVFLCLAALYESWSIPFSVILVVPLGILGAVLATLCRGLTNDVFFQIGMITTMGLAAKNAILIVEFARELHEEGKPLLEAAVEAARLRLRPIIMTSMAFVLGVVPLAIAKGASSGSQHSIGTSVVGGTLAGTFLALFFVPLFFYVVGAVAQRLRKTSPAARVNSLEEKNT